LDGQQVTKIIYRPSTWQEPDNKEGWNVQSFTSQSRKQRSRFAVPGHAGGGGGLRPITNASLHDHFRSHRWLCNKHGLGVLSDAANDARDRLREVVTKILAVEATGLFGIGMKLAALPPSHRLYEGPSTDPKDYMESVALVLSDINRLLGTGFVGVQDEQS
jgi:hypothetical protein